MDRMMYSQSVPYEDYLITLDEDKIEAHLLKMLSEADANEFTMREVAEYKSTLRKIDHLTISGEYKQYRASAAEAIIAANAQEMEDYEIRNPGFRAYLEQVNAQLEKPGGEIDRQLRNLFDGRNSPGPQQAARFRAMYDSLDLGSKTLHEVRHLLAVLEPAKRPKGRHSLPTPWANEIEHMGAIRLLVAGGLSVPQAARARANEEGRADAAERARTLEKLYRKRAQIRE